MRADGNQAGIVAALRATGHGVIVLSQVGGGCPDLLVGRSHSWALMEVKTDKGKLSAVQTIFWREHLDHGPLLLARDSVSAIEQMSGVVAGRHRNLMA